jgi:ectoine hydroxylase-related dioxygenase (phytanoyl-CoA dioxygenase family)
MLSFVTKDLCFMSENRPASSLSQDGFEIHRGVFSADEVEVLKSEADRVATEAGSACVRNLNARSELFRELANSAKLRKIFPSAPLSTVRSLLFDKTPEENWPVAWHQDLTIATKAEIPCEGYGPWSVKDGVPHAHAPVDLLSQMVTARIHLDPTPAENGALMVIPGSHQMGRIPSEAISDTAAITSITCECQPGDVLLMSPLILHASRKSHIPNRRRILHFEYAPPNALDPRLAWHED